MKKNMTKICSVCATMALAYSIGLFDYLKSLWDVISG